MLASRSTPRTIAAIALAACVACAVILWLAIRSPRGPEAFAVAAADRDPAASPPASASPEIEVATDASAARVDGTHAAEPVLPKIADLHLEAGTFRYHDVAPVTGQLVLRAVDRDTGVPLRSFSVRLASETRFAAESNVEPAEELALALTPDTYAVLVASPGYEPVELAPIAVAARATVRPDPVALSSGSGSIAVSATGAEAFNGLSVQLRGSGRRPCGRCAVSEEGNAREGAGARCTACGRAKDDTVLRLGSDGRAEFTGLASGLFALRIVDACGRALGDERRVDLAPAEAASLAFDVSQWRRVEVEIVDADGFSLSAEWARRLAVPRAEEVEELIIFEGVRSATELGEFEFRRDGDLVATAQLVPPPPDGVPSFGWSSGRLSFSLPVLPRPTADRQRSDADALRPDPTPPRFEPSEVSCDLDPKGIAVLAPVGTSALHLRLTAAGFSAEAQLPAGKTTTRVRMRLQPAQDSTSVTYREVADRR